MKIKNNPNFTLKITYDSKEMAETIYNAILIEHNESQIKSKCIMELRNNTLFITSLATEVSILKASFYSYIRWIKTAESIYKLTI
jgi:KEOPS complex subunit Pcc1